jgi:hypothetical protein
VFIHYTKIRDFIKIKYGSVTKTQCSSGLEAGTLVSDFMIILASANVYFCTREKYSLPSNY